MGKVLRSRWGGVFVYLIVSSTLPAPQVLRAPDMGRIFVAVRTRQARHDLAAMQKGSGVPLLQLFSKALGVEDSIDGV